MEFVDVPRRWYAVIRRPYAFYDEVNSLEEGQSASLVFFTLVVLVARLPGHALRPEAEPVGTVLFAAVLLILSPPILHVLTGVEYVLLWVVTDEDEGVDRTLRAVAYSTAPAVVASVPFVGVVSLYGVYLQYVGVRQGHGASRPRAFVASLIPSIALFGVGFEGVDNLLRIAELAVGV